MAAPRTLFPDKPSANSSAGACCSAELRLDRPQLAYVDEMNGKAPHFSLQVEYLSMQF